MPCPRPFPSPGPFVDAMVLRDEFSLGSPPPGDYNWDWRVNAADYTVWADHFGQTGEGIPGDGNGDGTADSADYAVWADHFGETAAVTVDDREYARQDANWNVTSLVGDVDSSSTLTWGTLERFEQDPYGGNLTVLYANFSFKASGFGGSDFGWQHFHQGGRVDIATGLMSFRSREYDPNQGRWVQQDYTGYSDGANLYQMEKSDPVGYTDPTGLKSIGWVPGKGYPVYKGDPGAVWKGDGYYSPTPSPSAPGRIRSNPTLAQQCAASTPLQPKQCSVCDTEYEERKGKILETFTHNPTSMGSGVLGAGAGIIVGSLIKGGAAAAGNATGAAYWGPIGWGAGLAATVIGTGAGLYTGYQIHQGYQAEMNTAMDAWKRCKLNCRPG